MGVRLNRCLAGVESLRAGEFTVATESARPVLCCPLCGEKRELPPQCRIEPDGKAVPAVKCLSLACPFFEYVELADIWEDAV